MYLHVSPYVLFPHAVTSNVADVVAEGEFYLPNSSPLSSKDLDLHKGNVVHPSSLHSDFGLLTPDIPSSLWVALCLPIPLRSSSQF